MSLKIWMNDFTREPADRQQALLADLKRVLHSGRYVLDWRVKCFEALWAGACGTRFGIGVGNGMDAIEIALRASGIVPGDEVIVPAITAFATLLAVLRSGATPVVADIEPGTALLDRESARRVLSARTKAVVLVHLYGRLADMDAWVAFCNHHGLILIEDAAQAHWASVQGRAAGSFGLAGAFSFYPTKNLGAIGDGGMVVTNDEAIAATARQWRDYGRDSGRLGSPHLVPGLNSRLDELQAAFLTTRLAWLQECNDTRRKIARAYQEGIRHPLVALPALPADEASHVHHLFVVNSPVRDALRICLEERGIQTALHYPLPVHRQPACGATVRIDPAGLARAEAHAQTCLSLPCHPFLTPEEVETVVEAINDFSGWEVRV
ncbi:dTDP-3-amino-3,6-dideoxy-alpha-D-galactopyranose transaminase [Candidatus Magnetaquicoccaceae bacterium FCR-1]|uniref:dTDP-3-amino-3,6-dideoxy-alpha-D-galactopyranose transaminase n=1 Tax=Candidatus Magnetaquiglobus chichijimensis TaxID=3141448 RepID=A0ABQ0C624_9PROT